MFKPIFFTGECITIQSTLERIELATSLRWIAFKDYLKTKNRINTNTNHLKATIEWIKKAQNSSGNGGVSAYLNDFIGWENPYPETTGYIIPTMFDYYHYSGDTDCKIRAIRMSDFLMSIQQHDGSFRLGSHPSTLDSDVFDTGQCLEGFVRCYKETSCNEYLASAKKAADWIVSLQDSDGAWRRFSFNGIPHTYYTRVALALLELHEIVEDRKYKIASIKNVEWASANCNNLGWYHNCAFDVESMSHPTTHVIGYTVEGILECGIILNDDNLIKTATKTLKAIFNRFAKDGYLKGTYDEFWESNDKYSCLTGDAQIATLWLRLFELTNEQAYYESAVKLNNYLKSTQYIHHRCEGIRGGIKGSQPIFGDYNPYRYLNWAAKFFVDSLLRQETLSSSK